MTTTSLHGDNTLILPTLPRAGVQCVVTSPPYYGLRDYGLPPTDWPEVAYAPMAGPDPIIIPAMSCCLGLEPTPVAYIGHLVHTWRLLAPVLRDDATVWLNLGDSYANTADGSKPHTGMRIQPSNTISKSYPKISPGLKTKDLLGIPWRAAFALQADGWYLRSDVIWAKPNPMPESVTDRPTKAHEYMFLLAKSERYYYDAAAVAEPASEGERRVNRIGGYQEKVVPGRGGSAIPQALTTRDVSTRNRRTVWNVATQPYSGAHFAVMPEALIEPCVLAGSAAQACEVCGAPWVRVVERPVAPPEVFTNRNAPIDGMVHAGSTVNGEMRGHGQKLQNWRDANPPTTTGFAPSCRCPNTGAARSIVLDLYGGSGTVGRVTERLQRDCVLIDLNGDYIELQAERTNGVQVEMFV